MQLPAVPVACMHKLVSYCINVYIYTYKYIYAAQLVHKGLYRYICIYSGHICIYWALKQYVWPLYICLVCSFISLNTYCLLNMFKCVQMYENACSVAHHLCYRCSINRFVYLSCGVVFIDLVTMWQGS